jgi:alanyl-tRNA synthetase
MLVNKRILLIIGGGRPDLAQAGGPDAGAANDAVAAIENTLTGPRSLSAPTERAK